MIFILIETSWQKKGQDIYIMFSFYFVKSEALRRLWLSVWYLAVLASVLSFGRNEVRKKGNFPPFPSPVSVLFRTLQHPQPPGRLAPCPSPPPRQPQGARVTRMGAGWQVLWIRPPSLGLVWGGTHQGFAPSGWTAFRPVDGRCGPGPVCCPHLLAL